MSVFAADSFEEIGIILAANRRREYFIRTHLCALKNNGKVPECWCYRVGQGGRNAPCSEAADADPAVTVVSAPDHYEGCGLPRPWSFP